MSRPQNLFTSGRLSDALAHLDVGADPAPLRALVAGIALGDTGALPPQTRAELRSSGLYHLVTVGLIGHRGALMNSGVTAADPQDRIEPCFVTGFVFSA
jgi:hypothetical protein